MSKIKKPFRFTHTFTQKVVRDLRIVTETLDVEVSGTGYNNTNSSVTDIDEKFSIDIDFIIWKGKDVTELVEFMGCFEEVQEAAFRHVVNLFLDTYQTARA
jgi:hypothetical protein